MLPLIEKAKAVIPKDIIALIRPVVCGGDTVDDSGLENGDPVEHEKHVLECRKRILDILKEQGFGKPRVKWNRAGETSSLIADLKKGELSVECGDERVTWSIYMKGKKKE